jgi:predicted ABC-type ATPase
MVDGKPVIQVFAGPNGSGKTVMARNFPNLGTHINADDLKRDYGLTDLEAAQQAEVLRNNLLEHSANFSFETVLSTERNLLLFRKAREQGYEIRCVYLLTCNENINIARVRARMAAGGHGVPESKIRARYHRALILLPRLIEICDKILIYDNSADIPSGDIPTLIYSKINSCSEIFPNGHWSKPALQKLLQL